jgi:hypothetical protein
MSDHRQTVVTLAEDLLIGRISYQQFQDSLPDDFWGDNEVDELVDMIMHEPHVGRFLGVSKAQGEKHRAEILQHLEALRQSLPEPTA